MDLSSVHKVMLLLEMTTWSNFNFQDSCSPLSEQLVLFHDRILVITILIYMFVSYLLLATTLSQLMDRYTMKEEWVESIWTLIPALILLIMAFPSLHLLYLMDDMLAPSLTMKIIGHQWYWSHEYSDFPYIEFDSYMEPTLSKINSNYRLLDINNKLTLPLNVSMRMIITSQDVLHSWTVPSLGIKVDAVPGRLNQMETTITRPGYYYGQCSEICGINHSFMPICVESLPLKSFLLWTKLFPVLLSDWMKVMVS
uniref:Cytochrome c oxidase subunit 2 n=1 Tax=Xenophyes cascus TaxID=984453 RepID=A0A077UP16_9HEMI|nr:Cytochrome c oxidase subunit 2 [Xenophyes cascus]